MDDSRKLDALKEAVLFLLHRANETTSRWDVGISNRIDAVHDAWQESE